MNQVTRILSAIDSGDSHAAEKLLPLVYDELRRLAAAEFSRLPPGQTLQATALVHEAWLRLAGNDQKEGQPKWDNRRHFFGAAAQAMRHILVDCARRKGRVKHWGNLQRVGLEEVQLADSMRPDELLALDEALARLEEFDPQAAELTKLRYFAGFTQQQTAELLGVNKHAADRLWSFARAFLLKELQTASDAGG